MIGYFKYTLPYGEKPTIRLGIPEHDIIRDEDTKKMPNREVFLRWNPTEMYIEKRIHDWEHSKNQHIKNANKRGTNPNLPALGWDIFLNIQEYMRFMYAASQELSLSDKVVVWQRLKEKITTYTRFIINNADCSATKIAESITENEFRTLKESYSVLYPNVESCDLEWRVAQDIFKKRIKEHDNAYRLYCYCCNACFEAHQMCYSYESIQASLHPQIVEEAPLLYSFVKTNDKEAVVKLLGDLLYGAKGKKVALILWLAANLGFIQVVTGEYAKLYKAIRNYYGYDIGSDASINKYIGAHHLYTSDEIKMVNNRLNELFLVATTKDNL